MPAHEHGHLPGPYHSRPQRAALGPYTDSEKIHMAGLNIFGTDPENQPKPRQRFADDIVGRFRAGHQVNNVPSTLNEWRVTTGDPDVASKIHDLLGGDEPQEWETKGDDSLEVFTASADVDIIIEGPRSLRQRMVLWGRQNKPIYVSDGAHILDDNGHPTDEPDPDAELTFAERKQKGRDGLGAIPDIDLTFRLADDPDLGIFQFKTGSWGLARDLVATGTAEAIANAEGPLQAKLRLEEVSFVAKNGPRRGQTVTYTASRLELQ